MNSKIKSIKNKLKSLLKDKEIIDILVFGSLIKGKAIPRDIDIALITSKESLPRIEGFHISTIKPIEFFKNPPTLANTLLREGYSLKYKKFLAELLNFKNKAIFIYELKNQKASDKVRIVNILRGKNKKEGIVKQNKGEWLSNQVFIIPVNTSYILEQFFLNFNIKFKKFFILMH
jgi:predicted nucleotidyltransferase